MPQYIEDEPTLNENNIRILGTCAIKEAQSLGLIGMEEVIAREKVDLSVVIGPAVMMKFASLTTKKHEIPTYASLNTIMVDGTGMCGACRVSVGGRTKFVCIDGPEFDAHKVDFDEMLLRLNGYKDEECKADASYKESIAK